MSSSRGKHRNTHHEVMTFESVDFFTSLNELWQYNWDKLHETNDLSWLIVGDLSRKKFNVFLEDAAKIKHPSSSQIKEIKEAELILAKLQEVFYDLIDEWSELVSSNGNSKEIFATMRKLILARAEVFKGSEDKKNWTRKFEQHIKDLTGDVKKHNSTKERVQMQIVLKTHIDPKKVTVIEYHYYMEEAIAISQSNIDG